MAKLDDFLTKKKETAPVLDLSNATATVNSQEEFRRLAEKIPDFKMRSEKVASEGVKLRDKFKINVIKHDKKIMNEEYTFMNPIPVEMRNLDLDDLASVSIDWRMLTTQRPKLKLEEDYFSRLVELAKLRFKSRAQEKRQFELDPMVRKTKNKAGIVETRVVSCTECGEDFCNGKVCGLVGYEAFVRIEPQQFDQKPATQSTGAIPKKNRRGRSRSKTKSSRKNTAKKSKSARKSKSKSPKGAKSISPRIKIKSPRKFQGKFPRSQSESTRRSASKFPLRSKSQPVRKSNSKNKATKKK